MSKTKAIPTLESTYHEVRGQQHLTYVDHETVSQRFLTEWRGRPVVVDMEASRYTYTRAGAQADEWSSWRIFAQRAKDAPTEDHAWSADLTGTARHRLCDELEPVVSEWLKSPAYATSRTRAFASFVHRQATDLSPHSEPTKRFREILASYRHELIPIDVRRFENAADAFDHYAAILETRS